MNTRLTVWMLLAAGVLAATPWPVWAGVVEELTWAENEMDAPADTWDRPALAAACAGVLKDPNALTAREFLWARALAARVAVEVFDRTAADRRVALNDFRVKAIDDATGQYLSADATDPRERMAVFEAQLHTAGEITNRRRSRAVQQKIATALAADVKAHVVDSDGLSVLAKAALIRRAVQTVETIPPAPVRQNTLMRLYGYAAALKTPDAAAARLEQGKLLLAAGKRAGALERFDAVLKDATAQSAERLEARRLRVRLLTGGVFVRDAAAEIEALAASDLPADAVMLPEAVWARRRAGRVLLAAGYWTLAKYRTSAEDLVADLIEQPVSTAPQRADLAADVLADMAVEYRRLGQPHAALGYGRGAYNLCSAPNVSKMVDLIHSLLARGSGPEPSGTDGLAAADFLARQRGWQRSPGYSRTLAPDLCNDVTFPKPLAGAVLLFEAAHEARIEAVARNAEDPLARAVAAATLGRCDDALAAAAKAIGPDPARQENILDVIVTAARCVRGLHESVAVESGFRRYHSLGPAGRDGRTGTADDTFNVAAPTFDVFAGRKMPPFAVPDVGLTASDRARAPADTFDAHYIRALAELVRGRRWADFRARVAALGLNVSPLPARPGDAPRATLDFGTRCGGVITANRAGALKRPLEGLAYNGFDRPVLIFSRLDSTWPVICRETFKALSGRTRAPIVGPDLAAMSLDDLLRLPAWAGACSGKAHSIIVNFTTPAGAEPPGQGGRADDRTVVALAMIRLGAPTVPIWVAVDLGGSARWFKRIAAWDEDLYSGIAVTGPAAANACRTAQEARRIYLEIGRRFAPKPVGMVGYALPDLSDRLAKRDDAALVRYAQLRAMLTTAGFKFVHIKER